jgi:hypothetical protein
MKHVTRWSGVLSLAALALMIPARGVFAAPPSDSNSIPKVLEQVKQHAAEARDDAAALDSYRYLRLDRRSYAERLNMIREHANDLFQDYYQLQRLRDRGTPAQREAIDKLDPLVREMATELTNNIQLLNDHQHQVNMPRFGNQVHVNWEKINAVYEHLCKCTDKRSKI